MSTFEYTPKEILNKPVICHRKITHTIKILVSFVSVEPTVFLTVFSSIMYQLVIQNLYLEKACRVEIRFNESVCDAMTKRNNSGYTLHQETEVQKMVSQMLTLRTIIQGSFPLIIVTFAGSWSDRHNRRKPLILVPIVGEILCCLLLIVNTIFFYELPLIFTTLGDSIPFALFGGWPCFNNGIFSYVGTKYKDEEKTFRVGIVTATLMAALLFGSSAGGIIYQQVGFIAFFSICTVLLTIAFIIGYLKINDESTKIEKKEKDCTFKDLFAVSYVVDTIKTSFKSGPNKRRYKIVVLIVTLLVVTSSSTGEISMNYMYTRLRFLWNAAHYAAFASVHLFAQLSGSMVAVLLFSKILKLEDSLLGIISLMGSLSSNFIMALTSTELMFFIGACCDAFQMCSTISVRSLTSKIVPSNELGQTNSMLALAEALVPLIFGPIYSTLYQHTVDVFPGTYFFLSAGLRFLALSLFLWLYKESVMERRRSKKEANKRVPETYKTKSNEV